MDLSNFDEVGKLIRIPADHVIGLFVAIGKSVRAPSPRAGQLSREDVVVWDHF